MLRRLIPQASTHQDAENQQAGQDGGGPAMRFTRASHHSSPKMVEPHGDSGELAIGAGKSRRVVICTLSLEKTDAGRELAKGELP